MKTLLLLLFSLSVLFGSDSIRSTATQAAISYTAPANISCRFEISENGDGTYLPLVPDVNPALYNSADQDYRIGSTSKGLSRTFVAGLRDAPAALNGVRYSRALQTATTHYYRRTCGAEVTTGTFTTMSIPFGNTYGESLPTDPDHPGEYAYPSLDAQDITQTGTDPKTGIKWHVLDTPGSGNYYGPQTSTMTIGRGAAWSGVSALLAGTGQATIASSTSPLFLARNQAAFPSDQINPGGGAYGSFNQNMGYYRVHLTAAINVGGTSPVIPANAKYDVCITVNGVSCAPGLEVRRIITTATLAESVLGTTNLVDLWQLPGGKVPDPRDTAGYRPGVVCDGTTTVLGSFDPNYPAFNLNWTAGSKIAINSVEYTIAQVNNVRSLTLTATCPTGSYGSAAHNFGVLVWKETASADTLTVSSASVDWVTTNDPGLLAGGGYSYASPASYTGPNGHQWWNYIRRGTLYSIDDETGQSHYRGLVQPGEFQAGCPTPPTYKPGDPNSILCSGTDIGTFWLKMYMPVDPAKSARPGIFDAIPHCTTTGSNVPPYTSQQPCAVYTSVIPPSLNLATLMESFTSNPAYAPQFEASKFPNLLQIGIDDNQNLLYQWVASTFGQGGSLGWMGVFNPLATSNAEGGTSSGAAGNHGCVGGGSPGCIVAAMPSWDRPGCRWCTIKGTGIPYNGWAVMIPFIWANNTNGTGPFTVPVVTGTANGTGNFLDASTTLGACPSNSFSFYRNPQQYCTRLTIGAEPSTPQHGSESGLPGEFGVLKVGDYLSANSDYFNYNRYEIMVVIEKTTGVVAGTYVVTLLRGINAQGSEGYYGYTPTGANPVLTLVCGANQLPQVFRNGGGVAYWNFVADPHGMNPDGTTLPPDAGAQGDHGFFLNGNQATSSTNGDGAVTCLAGIYGCYGARSIGDYASFNALLASPQKTVRRFPDFAGSGFDGQFNSHPTDGGINADSIRVKFFFDGRNFLGGSAGAGGGDPATLVSGTLYKFTAAQVPASSSPYRKWNGTGASMGNRPLLDISGPGSVITGSTNDRYKYCQAAVAGECFSGSSVGDVYINAPYASLPYCWGAAAGETLSSDYDICFGDQNFERDAAIQLGSSYPDNFGTYIRKITGWTRTRMVSKFFTPYVIPNGRWIVWENHYGSEGNIPSAVMIGKLPPVVYDSVDRTSFQPIPITIPARSGSDGAYIKFGYAENGAPQQTWCTSRREACVANIATYSESDPFKMLVTESFSPLSCPSGCQIKIPALSQRMLYYQLVYTNAGSITYKSTLNTVAIP